jgi:hypothetical protein
MRRRKGTLRAMTPMKCDIIWECLFELCGWRKRK